MLQTRKIFNDLIWRVIASASSNVLCPRDILANRSEDFGTDPRCASGTHHRIRFACVIRGSF